MSDAAAEVPRVRTVYDDAPVHCVDVLDGNGDRLIRIRPGIGRVSVQTSEDGPYVSSLSCDEADELARAIENASSAARHRGHNE